LRVVAIEPPTIIAQAADGSGHYGRKARTLIEDMYVEDAPGVNGRLNSRIRTELAAVAVEDRGDAQERRHIGVGEKPLSKAVEC